MSWESCGVVGFDLGSLLQGQTRIAKVKSAYNSLIIVSTGSIGRYFGLAFATPPPRVERFSALTL